MTARIFINGRFVGELEYEHPKDENGKTVPVPSHPRDGESVVCVVITDEENLSQWAAAKTLDHYTSV